MTHWGIRQVWDVWFEAILEEDGAWVFVEIDGPKHRNILRRTSRAILDIGEHELHVELEVLDPPEIVLQEKLPDRSIQSRPPFTVKSVRNLVSTLLLYGALHRAL
ncbi:MAG: hypothetical protein AAGF12_30270, partial [Myxococcota bacterium]